MLLRRFLLTGALLSLAGPLLVAMETCPAMPGMPGLYGLPIRVDCLWGVSVMFCVVPQVFLDFRVETAAMGRQEKKEIQVDFPKPLSCLLFRCQIRFKVFDYFHAEILICVLR